MRVCFFGLYDPEYPRNAILRRGLERAGIEVVECRAPLSLAPASASRSEARAFGIGRLRDELVELGLAVARALYLTQRFLRLPGPIDVVITAEFNQGLTPLAALLAWISRAPLVVDFLISLYDTAVNDRRLLKPMRPRAIYRRLIDTVALRLAHCVIADTQADADYFEREFGGVRHKVRVVPVGAPEWLFQPSPPPPRGERPLMVLYYGNFVPLHGIEHVVQAARLLRDHPRFRFLLVGSGQTYRQARAAHAADPSPNVEFHPPVGLAELRSLVERADICLGVFGTSDKAKRVVPNKVWQCLAAGRPMITGDGPGPRSVLEHGGHCLLVPPGDACAIVTALDTLERDAALASTLAANGAQLVRDRYTSGPLGEQLAAILHEVVEGTRTRARARETAAPNTARQEPVPQGGHNAI